MSTALPPPTSYCKAVMRWLTVAANQDVIQGSVAARVLNCHAQEHAMQTYYGELLPKSETKNSKLP